MIEKNHSNKSLNIKKLSFTIDNNNENSLINKKSLSYNKCSNSSHIKSINLLNNFNGNNNNEHLIINSINNNDDTESNIINKTTNLIISNQLEQSKQLLSKLDSSFDYLYNNNNLNKDFKEEIGFCVKCRKLISLKYTSCGSCSKHFCKNHREAHQCELNVSYSNKAKIIDGKNAFMKRLKQNKIKAGVI